MTEQQQPDKKCKIKKKIPARLDKKFGLGVIDSQQEVFVSSILPGSLASEHFKIKDRLVSIMGVKVQDKLHCRDLILLACDSLSEFEVVIERHSSSFTIPEAKPEEVSEIPDLQFHPVVPQKSQLSPQPSTSEKKHKKKDKKPKKKPITVYQNYLGDDEFAVGEPLDGLKFPMPPDVREILNLRTKQILTDFLETPMKKHKEAKKVEEKLFSINTEAQEQKIASDVTKRKSLIKPRKRA